MKKSVFLLFLLWPFLAFAQQGEATLTTIGEGHTRQEAVSNALRSAVEQAYGVFVSANTEILNDEIVKDEIATVSSGNIKTYTELAVIDLPNGDKSATIRATVSIDKIVSYAKNKGAQCELAGATFMENVNLYKLRERNAKKTLSNLYYLLDQLAPNLYDYEIELGQPSIAWNNKDVAVLPATIIYKANNTTVQFFKLFVNTLKGVSLTEEQQQMYESHNFEFAWGYRRIDRKDSETSHPFSLYSELDQRRLNSIFVKAITGFRINDNTNGKYTLKVTYSKERTGEWLFDHFDHNGILVDYHTVFTDYGCKVGDVCFKTKEINLIIPLVHLKKINKIAITSSRFPEIFYAFEDDQGYSGGFIDPVIYYSSSTSYSEINWDDFKQYRYLDLFGGGVIYSHYPGEYDLMVSSIIRDDFDGEHRFEGVEWCKSYGDHTWRLPTTDELKRIIEDEKHINFSINRNNRLLGEDTPLLRVDGLVGYNWNSHGSIVYYCYSAKYKRFFHFNSGDRPAPRFIAVKTIKCI